MAENSREKESVDYYFNLAAQQYAAVNLLFFLDHAPYSQIKAVCVGVKKGFLVAKVSLERMNDKQIVWGSEVNGYFTVRDDNLVHCHFKSRLVRMYNAPDSAMLLVFPLPRFLDFNQQRFTRRVRPNEELLEEIRVWHGEMHGGDYESLPQMRWINLDKQSRIGDISANGMMLEMAESSPFAQRININDRVLVRGNFGVPSKELLLFIIGRVVRKTPDIENPEQLAIGCSFLNWRRVDDTRNTSWLRCDPQEGIAIIAQWASRNFRGMRA